VTDGTIMRRQTNYKRTRHASMRRMRDGSLSGAPVRC